MSKFKIGKLYKTKEKIYGIKLANFKPPRWENKEIPKNEIIMFLGEEKKLDGIKWIFLHNEDLYFLWSPLYLEVIFDPCNETRKQK